MRFRHFINAKSFFVFASIFAQGLSLLANWFIFQGLAEEVIGEIAIVVSYNAIFAVVVFFRHDIRLIVQDSAKAANVIKDIAIVSIIVSSLVYFIVLTSLEVSDVSLVLALAVSQALMALGFAVLTFFSHWKVLGYARILYSSLLIFFAFFLFDSTYSGYLLILLYSTFPVVMIILIYKFKFLIAFSVESFKKGILYESKEFLLYSLSSTPLSFLNTYVVQGPIFLLGNNVQLLSSYFLFNKFIVTPLAAILAPLSTIWLKRFVTEKGITHFFNEIKWRFFASSLAFYLILIVLVYFFYELTGVSVSSQLRLLITIYTPVALWQMWVSSMSNVIPARNSLHLEVLWKLPAFLLIFGLVHFDTFMDLSILNSILVLAVLYFVLYAGFYRTFYSLLKG